MRLSILTALTVLVASLALTAGCGDDACKNNDDCPDGRICRLGLCALDPGLTDTLLNADTLFDVTLACDPAGSTDLVLNELLADPPAGADVNGDGVADTSDDEFVEIVNVSTREVGLANVQVDVGGKKIAAGAICLPPNAARVLYGKDGLPALTNGGASVSLVIDGLVAQTVSYGSEGGNDQALTLAVQLDRTASWVKHKEISTLAYSPGKCANGNDFPNCTGGPVVEADPDAGDVLGDAEVVAACSTLPLAGDLVINELLADPGTVNDANQDGVFDGSQDEFVEIVNASASTLLLAGVQLTERGNKTFTFPAGTCLAPGQAAVMFGKYESGGDFAGALAFGFGGTFGLNNGDDTVTLKNAAGVTLDSVTYGAEADSDQSITRAVDGDLTSAFVKHTAAANAAGARMSPGRCQSGAGFPECGGGPVEPQPDAVDATDTISVDTSGGDTVMTEDVGPSCGPAATVGDLAINEVGANAGGLDWNADGVADNEDDEFVEVVSRAAGAVELAGVKLKDAAGGTFTFPALCLPAGHAVLVFGAGNPFGASALPSGNVAAQKGLPGLNNGAETLTLLGAGSETIDSYTQSSAAAGESRVRDPERTGAFVGHKAATGSAGAAASPGRCTTGATFPTCL